MNEPQIALISAGPADTVPATWKQYQSVSALQGDAALQAIIVLDLPENSTAQTLMLLRQDHRYRYTLIFSLKPQHTAHPLADGALPATTTELHKEYAELNRRLATFNRGRSPERLEEHVMAWLWSRPQAEIIAQRDTSLAQMYSYPLIKAFSDEEAVNESRWLRLMVEQGWLAEGELIDRVRHCLQCNSARLNYVDVCPECKDLDIARQPALHCFTCGHVAPQEQFLKEGLLLCPNCLTKLRHIGSDYDRPLENQNCRACRTPFMDAEVQARCLDCGHAHQPEDLRVREVRTYRITEKGRLRCRLGLSEKLATEYFDRLNLISLNDFTMLLDWQIQQSRRYQTSPACSLLAFQFDRLEGLLDSPEGQAALDNLIERLEQSTRDTDRCTRSREDLLWFLLPHTDRQGVEVLWQRLHSLVQTLDASDVELEVKMAALTLPNDLLAEESAELMMARLAGEVG